MSRLKQTIYQLLLGDGLYKLLPVNPNRFLFSSFFGQHYSDGPRAISEALHARSPQAEIWWDFADGSAHQVPDYVRVVDRNTADYFRIKTTAAFHITNVYQQAAYLSGRFRKDLVIRTHLRLENRRNQAVLTTWHGTPFKKMRGDQVGGKDQPFCRNAPLYYLVGNRFEESVMERITQGKMIPLRFGSVRGAQTLSPAEVVARKRGLGLDPETHVVLYAPTFRSGPGGKGRDPEASGLSQLRSLDPERLAAVLKARFGWEKTVLFCRFHNQVEQAVDWDALGREGRVRSGNDLEDIRDYYAVSDLVLTDYSSVMFDFMPTGRPVCLLCPDFETYRDRERGLYFTPEELPFPMAKDWTELETLLRNFDETDYAQRVRAFMDRLGYYEGDALARTVDFLTAPRSERERLLER